MHAKPTNLNLSLQPLNIVRISNLLVLLIFMSLQSIETAGQAYEVDKRDWVVGSGGVMLNAIAIYLHSQVTPLDARELDALSASSINKFDRNAINQFKISDSNTSNVLLGAALVAPFSLLLDKDIRSDYLPLAVMLSEVAIITGGITNLSKNIVLRNRPFVYNTDAPLSLKTTKTARLSFFSGHVSNAAAMSFFTAHVVSTYSKNATVKVVVWIGAAALPAVTGYLRYSSGKHFPTDIIAGYLVGASIGYLVPQLHKKSEGSKLSMQVSPASLRIFYQLNK